MRYFFHVQTDDELIEDIDGAEGHNDQVAYNDAVAAVREMLTQAISREEEPVGAGLLIMDEHSRQVGTIRFADHRPLTLTRQGSGPRRYAS